MKEITLEVFRDFDDAVYWLEHMVWELQPEHEDIKVEMALIDGNWRCGVIVENRQLEFKFHE